MLLQFQAFSCIQISDQSLSCPAISSPWYLKHCQHRCVFSVKMLLNHWRVERPQLFVKWVLMAWKRPFGPTLPRGRLGWIHRPRLSSCRRQALLGAPCGGRWRGLLPPLPGRTTRDVAARPGLSDDGARGRVDDAVGCAVVEAAWRRRALQIWCGGGSSGWGDRKAHV